jgi:hypothetical protein
MKYFIFALLLITSCSKSILQEPKPELITTNITLLENQVNFDLEFKCESCQLSILDPSVQFSLVNDSDTIVDRSLTINGLLGCFDNCRS